MTSKPVYERYGPYYLQPLTGILVNFTSSLSATLPDDSPILLEAQQWFAVTETPTSLPILNLRTSQSLDAVVALNSTSSTRYLLPDLRDRFRLSVLWRRAPLNWVQDLLAMAGIAMRADGRTVLCLLPPGYSQGRQMPPPPHQPTTVTFNARTHAQAVTEILKLIEPGLARPLRRCLHALAGCANTDDCLTDEDKDELNNLTHLQSIDEFTTSVLFDNVRSALLVAKTHLGSAAATRLIRAAAAGLNPHKTNAWPPKPPATPAETLVLDALRIWLGSDMVHIGSALASRSAYAAWCKACPTAAVQAGHLRPAPPTPTACPGMLVHKTSAPGYRLVVDCSRIAAVGAFDAQLAVLGGVAAGGGGRGRGLRDVDAVGGTLVAADVAQAFDNIDHRLLLSIISERVPRSKKYSTAICDRIGRFGAAIRTPARFVVPPPAPAPPVTTSPQPLSTPATLTVPRTVLTITGAEVHAAVVACLNTVTCISGNFYSFARGVPQGHPLSSVLCDIYISTVIDRWLAPEINPAKVIARWADDLLLHVPSGHAWQPPAPSTDAPLFKLNEAKMKVGQTVPWCGFEVMCSRGRRLRVRLDQNRLTAASRAPIGSRDKLFTSIVARARPGCVVYGGGGAAGQVALALARRGRASLRKSGYKGRFADLPQKERAMMRRLVHEAFRWHPRGAGRRRWRKMVKRQFTDKLCN